MTPDERLKDLYIRMEIVNFLNGTPTKHHYFIDTSNAYQIARNRGIGTSTQWLSIDEVRRLLWAEGEIARGTTKQAERLAARASSIATYQKGN